MKNPPIGTHEREDLRRIVERVLRDAGNPEPPLDLPLIRAVQKLDVRYYTLSDPSMLQEFTHQIRVGARLITNTKLSRLFDVVKKAGLSALWDPQKRLILIDRDKPELRHRWMEAHEIGHSLAPWHGRYLFGDHDETLDESCHEELEREANFAASKLLFLGERFREEARDSEASFDLVLSLHKDFGNSIPSTLRHFVEEAYGDLPVVGLLQRKKAELDKPNSYCIESPVFREQFGSLSEASLLASVNEYCIWARRNGTLGEGEVRLMDANGREHAFRFESWGNKYYIHTLGVYLRPVDPCVAVSQRGNGTNA